MAAVGPTAAVVTDFGCFAITYTSSIEQPPLIDAFDAAITIVTDGYHYLHPRYYYSFTRHY